ncbi:MAG: Cobyrinic acid ac-diamide synthase [Holophagaceae bacterium]|nr:Cobyrinic acid ac-diamide synthase [Holophagaceae bacterium]
MREIVVISGKGGTGKTSLTAAFAHLAQNKILCDLDVDAPDLHILLEPKTTRQCAFLSGHEATIDPALCQACGICAAKCRFGAIQAVEGGFRVEPSRCEGCKVCVAFCPHQAIDFQERLCGTWYQSETRFGPMIHAQLFPGQENSGRLVSLLKQQARDLAEQRGIDLIISDGSPGIGCPVIASLSQATLALIVTEPTPSGMHDLKRIAELCEHFRIRIAVLVNKWDLHPENTAAIESLCVEKGYALAGRLPHDTQVAQAMVQRKAVTELDENPFNLQVRQIWKGIEALLPNH